MGTCELGRPLPTASPEAHTPHATVAAEQAELIGGWRLLLACVAGVAFGSIGFATYSIGAFVKPLEAEFGWSRADVQGAILFSMGLGGIAAPLAGMLIDRFGARLIALTGLIGAGIGFLSAAWATSSIWTFYLAYALVACLGAGSGPVSWTRAIAGQFQKSRGLALGLALSGTGVSAIFVPPYVVSLIESFGWRIGFVGLSLLPVAIALPIAYLFFRPRDTAMPKPGSGVQATQQPGLTALEALRSYRFWVLMLSIIAMYLGITGIIPNLIPALTDRGYSPSAAAAVQSVFGLAVIFGRLLVGWLIDRYWAPAVAAAVLTPPVVACIIFLNDVPYAAYLFAALLAGMAAGAELDLLAFFTARYFGLRSYARTYSLLYAGVAVAAGIGPAAFAYVYEMTGSYNASFTLAAILFAIGGPCVLTLGRYPSFTQAQSAGAAPAEITAGRGKR
ncbi:MFS transporter [Peristeroidobacter soli]|uniref:MFS transporter n=1 Tax=Peristeroidobacter soli TaxID=2497877 RepID=UPI001C37C53F|nr:MFS transporter [Peristeroidobacter soli]